MKETTCVKLENLKNKLREYKKVCVGFSGGVDSTVLLKVSNEVSKDNFGIFIDSAFICQKDKEEVESFAKVFNVDKYFIDVLKEEEVISNPKNKCKYCKEKVFNFIKDKAQEKGAVVVDGLNMDDLLEYRPGIESTNKLGIKHPFVECEISKAEVYEIATHYNLPNKNKLSNSCLGTRVEVDMRITKEDLETVERLEEFLLSLGYIGTRVRISHDAVKIELRTF